MRKESVAEGGVWTWVRAGAPGVARAGARALGWCLLVGAMMSLGLFLAARALVRPAPGEWATRVPIGPAQIEVGVTPLIQWATTPWIARQLHGHSMPSRLGVVHLTWDEPSQQLPLQCQPCMLRSTSWGGEPLQLAEVQLSVQRQGTQLQGTLRSGAVQASWRGQLRAGALTLHISLPETPVREAFALFANALPEVGRAQIDGTLALDATLELPRQRLTVQPRLTGLAVSGLGTEAWVHARSQCARGLPTPPLGADSWLARAVIAAEDQRFYEHTGYDLVEMVQALQSNQEPDAPLRGASTLTQQVAKLLVTGGERSPLRKLRELLYAVEMEQTLGKARILNLYLEHAPWGATLCGAHAAAHAYFGQRADRLTPAQAVWLAAMLHSPAREGGRWRTSGQINQVREQWVARQVHALRKSQRLQLQNALAKAAWPGQR